MDDLERLFGAMVLRDRWRDIALLSEERIRLGGLSNSELILEERTKQIYATVRQELIARLGLTED